MLDYRGSCPDSKAHAARPLESNALLGNGAHDQQAHTNDTNAAVFFLLEKVKISTPLGNVPFSLSCLRSKPRVRCCKPLGNVSFSLFWLKLPPKAEFYKPLCKVTFSVCWLK